MSTAPYIVPIRRRAGASTRMQVYVALSEAIVRSELEPGRQLSENELASQLGVSRTPVREALARLREDRLVEVIPQIGTFVSRISDEAVGDAQFIREALECAAVRRAAELATEDDVRILEENLEAQQRAVDAVDDEAINALDNAFHQTLCELSRHPMVWAISQRAKGHLNRVRRLSLLRPEYLGGMLDEHRSILTAVERHDPDAAELALRYHLRMVLSELPAIRATHPDYFEEA
ncbi:MAG: GntR family transcriptional regulator [Solirubrobacteraceae bacterium]|nr:GntR family transcriptional regulator [Solirubrobacteraceae bacterium]